MRLYLFVLFELIVCSILKVSGQTNSEILNSENRNLSLDISKPNSDNLNLENRNLSSDVSKQDPQMEENIFSEISEISQLFPDLKAVEVMLENLLEDEGDLDSSDLLEDYSDEEDSTTKLIEELVRKVH